MKLTWMQTTSLFKPDLAALKGNRARDERIHRLPFLIFLGIFTLSIAQIPLVLHVSPTIIRGDGVGYYAYLRSAFFDHDLDFTNEYQHFEALLPDDSPPVTNDYLQAPQTVAGLPDNPWSIGTAVLWSPFFAVGHVVALVGAELGSSVQADGYTLPYQFGIALGSALYGFLGLLLSYRLCVRFCRPLPALLATLLVWFGTSLTAYLYFIPSMSHAISFFCTTLFIHQWVVTRERRDALAWLLLGAAAGLMIVQRVQNSVFLIVLVVEFLANQRLQRRMPAGLLSPSPAGRVVLFGAPALLIFFPQLIIWRQVYGRLAPNVYRISTGLTFDWLHPQFGKVLFACRHGLLSWTPLVIFSMIGLLILVRREGLLVAALGSAFLLQLYLVSAWPGWDQGAAFGSRMLVSSSGLYIFGLAALIQRLSNRMSLGWISLGGAVFVIWNYALLFQYGTGLISRHGQVEWSQVIGNFLSMLA